MPARKRLIPIAAVVAVLALLAPACGSSDARPAVVLPPDTDGLATLTGRLRGGGSSFQDTFQQQVAADFTPVVEHLGGDVTITYTKTGSSDGKKSLSDESIDFAGSDAPIKDEERANFGGRRMLYFPVMGGPITVAYNLRGVGQLNLSPDTIAGIFQATIQGAEKNSGATNVLSGTEGAVGCVDLADAAIHRLSVAKVANPDGVFVAPTPENAYPITAPTWVIVDAVQSDQRNADIIRAYLRYLLTTGQAQAKALLYAPLPEDLAAKSIAHLDDITVSKR